MHNAEQFLMMENAKQHIMHKLQKDILQLQGYKNLPVRQTSLINLGPIEAAFPNGCFPATGIHEFLSDSPVNTAATNGFIAGLLGGFMLEGAASVWISTTRNLFPPALKIFGLAPDKIIFIDLRKEKDILWVMEETLKCPGIAAVVGEMRDLDFTSSRRLQLAVEQSRLPGFIIREHPRLLNVNACIARWKITPLPSVPDNDLPGIGYPRWNVELLKVRNGKPGSWQLEWSSGRFQFIGTAFLSMPLEQKRKAG